jgi:ABC-2 type transport system ATP-binding protein
MTENIQENFKNETIQLQDASVRYGRIEALSHVSFTLAEHECIALLGLNGAGKTTTMRLLSGLSSPQSGTVRVFGMDPLEQDVQVRRRIGYLPEENFLDPALTLFEHMNLFAAVHGMDRSVFKQRQRELVDMLQLGDVLHRLAGGFSRGYRQRASLALVLLHNPGFVILDEPVTGLDPQQQEAFHDLVRQLAQDRIVLLSTHLLSEARELARRVLVLAGGHLTYDGPMIADDETTTRPSGRRGVPCVSGPPCSGAKC